MKSNSTSLTIGQLAKRSGVGADTVRFYERSGLLPKPARTGSGYRIYAPTDVDRMRFIKRAKGLGFTLDEIAGLLTLNAGAGTRREVKSLAEKRLLDLDRKITDLVAVRDALANYARRCSGHGPLKGCPIIEAVLANPDPAVEV